MTDCGRLALVEGQRQLTEEHLLIGVPGVEDTHAPSSISKRTVHLYVHCTVNPLVKKNPSTRVEFRTNGSSSCMKTRGGVHQSNSLTVLSFHCIEKACPSAVLMMQTCAMRHLFLAVVALLVCTQCNALLHSSVARTSLRSHASHARDFSLSVSVDECVQLHEEFMSTVAKVEPPKRLKSLLEMTEMVGDELVSPRAREGLNPFLIPISKSKVDGSLTCFIRWPTQKEGMELQLVKTTETGIELQALSTDMYCHRLAVELDFNGAATAAQAVENLNKDGQLYTIGDFMPFLKSGKFPSITQEDLTLVLDRYLLTKVGAFPDSYERLAMNFFMTGDKISALVTCERAVSLFYSWGHPIHFHTKMLKRVGRDMESKDSARGAMGMPMWTIARSKEVCVGETGTCSLLLYSHKAIGTYGVLSSDLCCNASNRSRILCTTHNTQRTTHNTQHTMQDLEEAATLAGFSSTKILAEMHAFRVVDAREKDIAEGLSPIQVTLDQAAHLMDAVALGGVEGGWDTARVEISKRYRDSGYPEMADFIDTTV
jgi:hypothetical protein